MANYLIQVSRHGLVNNDGSRIWDTAHKTRNILKVSSLMRKAATEYKTELVSVIEDGDPEFFRHDRTEWDQIINRRG